MPHLSIAAAEKAAIEGNIPDIDTQECRGLQEFLLSSLARTPNHVHNASTAIGHQNVESEAEGEDEDTAGDDIDIDNEEDHEERDDEQSQRESADTRPAIAPNQDIDQLIQVLQGQPELPPAPVEDAVLLTQELVARTHIRRDSKGRLRAFTIEGEQMNLSDFDAQHRSALKEAQRSVEMDDLTPKSSMSPTQENPASAYTRFDIQGIIREVCPSTANTDNAKDQNPTSKAAPHDSVATKPQHVSAWTDSTLHTYGENDTGHVELNFEAEIVDEEDQSQDASFAGSQLGFQFAAASYEPQTPAAPVNPFSQKGSVMKGADLFGATQPSSVARFVSPTSSRPSPADVYNDFTSPPKRQRISSSPLTRLYGQDPPTSPLQSSVRVLLATFVSADVPEAGIPRTSDAQSFDVPRGNSPPAPRPYVSMKESQERRRRDSMDARSDTDGSDSAEAIKYQRKRNRESKIKQELSTVALPSKRTPAPNLPQPSASPAVEVPSTGRRRSIQEDYLAKCEENDAGDTQQDNYIADSQGGSNRNNGPSQQIHASFQNGEKSYAKWNLEGESITDTPCRPRNAVEETITDSSKASPVPVEKPDADQLTQPDGLNEDDIPDQSLPGPSLPLNESSGNRSSVWTPMASKTQMLSDGPDTVPETSPHEQRIPTLGGIAKISFQESQLNIDELPGFSQDLEFERAVNPGSPKMPSSRPRSFRHNAASSPAISAPVVVAPVVVDGPTESAEQAIHVLPDESQARTTVSSSTSATGSKVAVLQENEVSKPVSAISKPDIPVVQALDTNSTLDLKIAGEGVSKVTPGDAENDDNDEDVFMPDTKSSTTNEDPRLEAEAQESHAEEPTPRKTGSRKSAASIETYAKGKKTGQCKSRASTVRSMSKPETVSTQTQSPRSESLTREGSITRRQSARGRSVKESTPAPVPKRNLRHSGITPNQETVLPTSSTRASKRKATTNAARDDSEDPLAITPIPVSRNGRSAKSMSGLFEKMAFAVSYIKNDQDRNNVIKLVTEYGGRLLEDGFDTLFNAIPRATDHEVELTLSDAAGSLGFTALIADEHSRKNKFMQALALGIPCISGRWISQCVAKMAIVEWTPYLLSAGQSSFLGNAIRSRVLEPYSASDAVFADVFSGREKLLEGKSVLLVTGKGKTEETRKAYVFLTRALGPARVGQAVDFLQARKRLVETEGTEAAYDLLYVEKDEKTADSVVFGKVSAPKAIKKRKRAADYVDADVPAPKKIRIIADETMVQSLILGQLLEEDG